VNTGGKGRIDICYGRQWFDAGSDGLMDIKRDGHYSRISFKLWDTRR
jgi:hypothetical protein